MPTTPPLVGREPALAALRAARSAAMSGHGRLVLIAGEPGIGKTALAGVFAAEAAGAGTLVLRGQCWDGDGAPAYWPWVQVLRAGLAAGGDAGEAARLLPERTAAPPAETADRFRLFDGVLRCLAGLAVRQPLLVVLDDLQWADQGSLRLLEFTTRHVTAYPILVVGAYRDEEAGPALRRLAAASVHVPLWGLDRAQVAELVGAVTATAPADRTVTEIWRRTGGNPLLVGELTRLMLAQGMRGVPADTPPALADRVRDILERRLARLSQPCADVLALAAVAGPEIRVELLAGLVPSDRTGAVPDLLDEAAEARVLAGPARPGQPYRFSHDLFRETIAAAVPAGRRRELHHAIGRALLALRDRGTPVHPAELAVHFAESGASAPAEAIRFSVLAAGEAAGRLAFEEASGHYERALAACEVAAAPDGAAAPDHAVRLDLLLRLGEMRNRSGDAAGALAAYQTATGLARRHGDATGLARTALATHTLGWRISHAASIELLEEVVRGSPDLPGDLRARVLACLARDLHHSATEPDWARSRALAERAVAEARALADPATLASCLLALHDAGWRLGSAEQRLPVVNEMIAAADEAGDRELMAQGRLLRATALLELGNPDGVAELATYCRDAGRLGDARGRYGALTRRATLAIIAGDLTAGERLASEALEFGREIGEPDSEGVHAIQCWASNRAAGRWYDLDEAADPAPQLPIAEAARAVSAGDLAAAGRALASLRLDDLRTMPDFELPVLAAELVVVAGTAAHRRELRRLLLPYAGRHVVVGGCASYLGAVDHYLGLLARAAGRGKEARGHFETAAALHEQLGATAWARRSRAEAAAALPMRPVTESVLRRDGDVWTAAYQGQRSHLPDLKGLRDLAVLLARPGEPVHAVQLYTGAPPRAGADPVLDSAAKAAYRRRLAELDSEIDDADLLGDLGRTGKARAEREALIAQLASAVGLGGRDRRLGDQGERARKAVTARIREAIDRIQRTHPALAKHLRGSVRTGLWCAYEPAEPVQWRL